MRILPGVLKELSKHVPTILFQAVEWNALAQELPKLSRRIIQKEGYQELFKDTQAKLLPFNIELSNEAVSSQTLKGNEWAGEQILTLYFAQLYSPRGLFLDLRSQYFKSVDRKLIWHPTSFWTSLDEDFRQGLLQVYEGFYLENEDLYYKGLKAIGLIQPNWKDEDKKALGDLFKNHFGGALHEKQSFDLDHFQESIVKMSEFMLNKKVKIPKDFLYVGVYLVGLYSTLEEVGESLPVRDIYLKAKDLAQK